MNLKLAACLLVVGASPAWGATINVTTTADDVTPNDGSVSLREAVTAINAGNDLGDPDITAQNPGTFGTNDRINFNIAGAGVHTITLTPVLPQIVNPVFIDGYSQPGSSTNTLPDADNATLVIQLSGVPTAGPGLLFNAGASGSRVRGLIINGFSDGIDVFANNCTVDGNFLGTDPTGLIANPNTGHGIQVGGNNNLIGGTSTAARNISSGNSLMGIFADNSGNNLIQGNFIGVDATGTHALGNGSEGIRIVSGGTGNLIGGTAAGARNIISGNTNDGVDITFGPSGNTVQGNFIGTDVTGTKAIGNLDGVQLSSAGNNIVGGTTAAARNIISGNRSYGVLLEGAGEANSVVEGNFIGTDMTGTIALGNALDGVVITDSVNNSIGGTAAGAGNVIAHNGGRGVGLVLNAGINNQILGNSIFDNSGLGIDLVPDGVTPNDTGDTDAGPNNLQNFPVLTSVTNSGGMTTINGRLNSTANTMYRVEFFANDAIDLTGYGQGQTYLGFKSVPTNGSGNVTFSQSFPPIGAEQRVTATATDPNGNTSEFCGAIGQLTNISTRMEVLTGNSVLIGGFIVGGSGSTQILLRALGPTLTQFGVTGVLSDPTLELHDGAGNLITSNDNWKDLPPADIMAIMDTGKAPPSDLEPAILHTYSPGNYTGIVRGKNNTTGIALIEAYDISKSVAITLTNISTRGFVDTDQNVMIGGFISGNGIVRVIVRALGPTLAQFGVTNVLADPMLEVHDGNGTLLASNDNWKDTQQAEIQASGKAPPNDKESAIIIVRPSANSTAIVRGVNNTTGNALVEVYVLPPM
jgi:CSLREA domain-containing protein